MLATVDVILSFIVLFIVWDIYLKPNVQRRIREKLDPYIKLIFEHIDMNMIEWLMVLDGDELKSQIDTLVAIIPDIDKSEVEAATEIILKEYDPSINADNLRELDITEENILN